MKTNVRTQLKEALQDALAELENAADYAVIEDSRDLGEYPPTKTLLQLLRQRITPAPTNPKGADEETWELSLISGQIASEHADTDLDDRFDNDLEPILDASPLFTWSNARRAIHKSNRHCFVITLTLHSDK